MLLMIDNYDSFTYNVVQYLAELGADVQVHRNDEITVEQIEALNPERLVISPAPVPQATPAFLWTLSAISPAKFRYWAFVWDTRLSARCSAAR